MSYSQAIFYTFSKSLRKGRGSMSTENRKITSGGGRKFEFTSDNDEIPCHDMIPPSQKRMLVHQSIFPESVAYNVELMLTFPSDINITQLISSVRALCEKYPEFHTKYWIDRDGFAFSETGPIFDPFLARSADLTDSIDSRSPVTGDMAEPFILNSGELLRCSLACSGNSINLVLVTHHICWDAESFTTLIGRLDREYSRLSSSVDDEPRKGWSDQKRPCVDGDTTAVTDNDVAYWSSIIERMHGERSRAVNFSSKGISKSSVIEKSFNEGTGSLIGEISRRMSVTEYAVSFVCSCISFGVALGSDRFTAASTPSVRSFSEGEEHFGYFANTLPHVIGLSPCDRLNDVIYRFSEQLAQSLRHSSVPYEQIVDMARLSGIDNAETLFDVMVQYSKFPDNISVGGFPVDCRVVPSRDIEVPAVVELFSRKSAVDFQFKYRKDVFSEVVADVISR
ncbi:condensation domain-containing protein, partial [Candidatus Corynebacterium faecigallinarum]|uniref:condensation domain-containing protein n=1 Tax=Candidatus Corynebacterium faecigallinarum TaxID=2838528 RepID=UPI003FD4CE80